MPRLAIAVLICTVAATPAEAGRTHFGWLSDTETVPQRGVELQSWLLEQDGRGDPPTDQTVIWWAPVYGLTDRVELALPIELAFTRTGTTQTTQLLRFGAEVRWRLVDADPAEAGPFAALIRLAVKRPVAARNIVRAESELVLSYDAGPVHLGADVGGIFDFNTDGGDPAIIVRPGVGLSVLVAGELRLGAEAFGEIQAQGPGTTWYGVGPNFALTHGRSWLSGAFLIGLEHIDVAPRVVWAIAF